MRRPGRLLAVYVAVAVLALSGCTRSQLDPDEEVTVRGSAADPAGAALADADVTLRAHPTGVEVIGGLGLGFGTVGLACAARPRPAICGEDVRHAETGADGGLSFELTGADTQDPFGNARRFSLTATAPPRDSELSGPATDQSFRIQVPELDLPRLDTWRPELELRADRLTAEVRWTPPPPHLGPADRYHVAFDNGHGDVVWEVDGGGRAGFDARLLEGTTGGVSVLAEASRAGPDTEIDIGYRSPRLPYRASTPPPASRGAVCFSEPDPDDQDQSLRPEVPCPLTDGAFVPGGAGRSGAASVVIDLGRPITVTLLAVRGCEPVTTCTVDQSVDGRVWSPLAAVDGPFASFVPPDRPQVRFLRVGDTLGDLLRIAEVSAWDDAPVTTSGAAVAIVAPEQLDVPRTADGGVPWLWLGIGALGATAVIALAVLLGLALGRRGRPPARLAR